MTRMIKHKAVIVESSWMNCTEEYQCITSTSPNLSDYQRTTHKNWGVKSIEAALDQFTAKGWQHISTTEVAGNERWLPDNLSNHGWLLIFKREVTNPCAEIDMDRSVMPAAEDGSDGRSIYRVQEAKHIITVMPWTENADIVSARTAMYGSRLSSQLIAERTYTR
jgi:hypothetical protein